MAKLKNSNLGFWICFEIRYSYCEFMVRIWNEGLLNNSIPRPIFAPDTAMSISERECSKNPILSEGSVQSCLGPGEGKAAAILAGGAYFQYVSIAKWGERRWRFFSTFPMTKKLLF